MGQSVLIDVVVGCAGVSFDLMDEETLAATDGIEIVSYTLSFKSVRFINQFSGDWTLQVRQMSITMLVMSAHLDHTVRSCYSQVQYRNICYYSNQILLYTVYTAILCCA